MAAAVASWCGGLVLDELAAPLRNYRPRSTAAAASGTAEETTETPKNQQHYQDSGYWERRFQDTEGVFDWYATWQELGLVFREFCPASSEPEVLVVGCGNSALSSEMCKAGYKRIVNIDIAAPAVEKMAQEFVDLAMEWRVMDATRMDFAADRFDLAVDKGTLDAMMHGGSAGEVAEAMVAEVWRTLRPGGLFLLVTHNASRQALLDRGPQMLCGAGVAPWEIVEQRKCRLSPQATMINILRSKLNGRPLAEAFKNVALLKEAADEAKATMKQMALLEALQLFKAKKMRAVAAAAKAKGKAKAKAEPAAATQSAPASAAVERVVAKAPASSERREVRDEEEGEKGGGQEAGQAAQDPRRQPFCWAYVLRKAKTGEEGAS